MDYCNTKCKRNTDFLLYLRNNFDLDADFGIFGVKCALDYFNDINIHEHVEAMQFYLKMAMLTGA